MGTLPGPNSTLEGARAISKGQKEGMLRMYILFRAIHLPTLITTSGVLCDRQKPGLALLYLQIVWRFPRFVLQSLRWVLFVHCSLL